MKLKSDKKFKNKSVRHRSLSKGFLLLGLALLVFYMAFYGIYDLKIVNRVEKITLSSETIGLKVGAKYQLVSSIYPSNLDNKTIRWKSSDEKVAKVNSQGIVTALKSGTAVITATSLNNKKVSDTVDIIVNKEDIKLESIYPYQNTIFLQKGYKYLIVSNFNPSSSNNLKLKYTSSNEDVASVDKFGFVTGKTIGKAIISITDQTTGVIGTCNIIVLSSGGELGNS